MFFTQRISIMSIRLTGLCAALVLAGCGLNPFADDGTPTYEPQQSSAATRSGSQSLEGQRSSSPVTTRPVTTSGGGGSAGIPIADNAPDRYVVKRGDTLWDISSTFSARSLVLAGDLAHQSAGRQPAPDLSRRYPFADLCRRQTRAAAQPRQHGKALTPDSRAAP